MATVKNNTRRYSLEDLFNFSFDEANGIIRTGMVQTQFANIITQKSTLVKTGIGILGNVTINKPVANGIIQIYDGIDNTGSLIGTITMPATLLNHPAPFQYDLVFYVGLYIVTSGATQDLTVTYN